MKYTLVKPDGTTGHSHEFDGPAPLISPNKGRWLPDEPPAYDPLTYTQQRIEPVPVGATSIGYTTTLRPASDVFAEKLAQLAAYRYQKEVAGITVNGTQIKTDRESQAAILASYTSLKDGLLNGISWKGKRAWVSLTLPQAKGIAQAVAAHVQACFQRERDLTDALQAIVDNPVAVATFDITSGWPA